MTSTRDRTLLIGDSAFMRKAIGSNITNDESLELIGVANKGHSGSEMALNLKPDIITDMVMSNFDGMYVVQTIMEETPPSYIILSALGKTSYRVFDVLQQGTFE